MAVIDRDLGWQKIKQEFEKLNGQSVAIGILTGSENVAGTSIAEYATANEFGANIKIAARSQQNYRKIKKNGDFARKGRFVKKDKSNFASWSTIGAHEIDIPPRPFMGISFDENKAEIESDIQKQYRQITQGRSTADRALTIIGQKHAQRVKRTIKGRDILPKLAKSTVKAKGSTKTLVDTGAMVNAVQIEIRGS